MENIKCYFVNDDIPGGCIKQHLYLFDYDRELFEHWNLTSYNLFFQGSGIRDGTFAGPALKNLTTDDEIDLDSYLNMRDEWFKFHLYLPTK